MKNLLLIFSFFFLLSCNNEEVNIGEAQGEYSITGKFLAPNTTDPISNAVVSLKENDITISTAYTDARGEFAIEGVSNGEYQVLLQKGLFSTERAITIAPAETTLTFDLDDLFISNFPKIGVVTGHYDNIQSILHDIGLVNPITGEVLFDVIEGINLDGRPSAPIHTGHSHSGIITNTEVPVNVDFDFAELLADADNLASYDILFLNCGLNTQDAETDTALYNYVSNGGIIYATDWAYPFLQNINTNSGTEHLTFQEPNKSGSSMSTEATILNDDLNDWLSLNFGITIDNTVLIDEFLPSWQVVDTFNDSTVTPWLNGEITYDDETGEVTEDKDLAFSYQIGDGGVLYSSFHTENHETGFSCTDRVIEYLVFEMSALATID